MSRISHQVMVSDKDRDPKYVASIKCIICGEQSNLEQRLALNDFTAFLKSFTRLHTLKGCNK